MTPPVPPAPAPAPPARTPHAPAAPEADPVRIEAAARLLAFAAPGRVAELRALRVRERPGGAPATLSGYYDDVARFARDAARLSAQSEGVYLTLNEIHPALLARRANRCQRIREGEGTTDAHVRRRRWLPVDLDPVRPRGISATAGERAAASARATQAAAFLTGLGFPDPVLADSGNGTHLLYPIDEPAEDGGLVRRCLQALALRFDDEAVVVDQANHNPARIWKVFGTVARKGEHLPDRPHRLATVLSAPDPLVLATHAALERLAAGAPKPEPRGAPPGRPSAGRGSVDPEAFVRRGEAERGWRGRWGAWQGGRKYVFDVCPFVPDHTDRAAYFLVFPSGAVDFGCHHNGCQGRGWPELRALVPPPPRAGPEAASGQAARGAGGGTGSGARPRRATEGGPPDDGGDPAAESAGRPTVVTLADVESRPVRWLWPGRVPLGSFTLLEGDPDEGKSLLTLDLAARLSRGRPLPDGSTGDLAGPQQTLLVCAEDALETTVRPRLLAAGGDAARVHVLTAVSVPQTRVVDGAPVTTWRARPPEWPDDAELVHREAERRGAAVLVIDPLTAHLGEQVNPNSDRSIRAALAPTGAWLQATGRAGIVVRHFNKMSSEPNSKYRGAGSIGLLGLARSALLVAPDPEDASEAGGAGERRVLARQKGNLAAAGDAPSQAYKVVVTPEKVPYVEWLGDSHHTARTLLAPGDPEEASALGEAIRVLKRLLVVPRKAEDLEHEAKRAGVSQRTLFRARRALGVAAIPITVPGGGKILHWLLSLPAAPAEAPASPAPAPTAAPAAPGTSAPSQTANGAASQAAPSEPPVAWQPGQSGFSEPLHQGGPTLPSQTANVAVLSPGGSRLPNQAAKPGSLDHQEGAGQTAQIARGGFVRAREAAPDADDEAGPFAGRAAADPARLAYRVARRYGFPSLRLRGGRTFGPGEGAWWRDVGRAEGERDHAALYRVVRHFELGDEDGPAPSTRPPGGRPAADVGREETDR